MRAAGQRSQHGLSLLEVLIAIVVLSIGVLGLAALQAATLRLNQSAHLQSQAASLAHDMAERLRSNRSAALAGAYDGVVPQTPPPACSDGPRPAESLAEQDIESWRRSLACLLPGGTGAVTRDGDLVAITVQWNDDRDQDDVQRLRIMTRL